MVTGNSLTVADYRSAREEMVLLQLVSRGIRDPRVLRIMGDIPREKFVPDLLRDYAYNDNPLMIGQGQTISQPYIVALMTEALDLKGDEKVLEIGTGSGYQTAILSRLSGSVYTVERIEPLMNAARKLLDDLGYRNIFFNVFDGTLGWSDEAPYDAIIVTAAAPHVPRPLMEQLREGGRLIVPVGDANGQELKKITKKDGRYYRKDLGGVVFVRLIGEHGWDE